jgi:5-methylcytosine-specific restriction enzyme subunit McrC
MPDVHEYGTVDLPANQLTASDVTRLRDLRYHGALTLSETKTGWRIKVGGTAGLLVLDRIQLKIESKFAVHGELLIHWLSYAVGVPVPQENIMKPWTTGPEGYAGLVGTALLESAEQLLREGLRQDYRRHGDIQPVLRGRLDALAQATRRYGQLDKLHTVTFDRDVDIWENRVLHTALLAASRLMTDAKLTRALAAAATKFPPGLTPADASAVLGRAEYNRLNIRYRAAHTWAGLALGGGGVHDLFSASGLHANTLLLAMPNLWERVTRRMISHAADAHGVSVLPSVSGSPIATRGDMTSGKTYRPDVLVRLTDTDWLPVDAKYKEYDHKGVASEDIHQLLTYIAGYRTPPALTAVLVHPRRGGHGHRELTVTGPHGLLGTIHAVGIDTDAKPTEAADWLSNQWDRLMR